MGGSSRHKEKRGKGGEILKDSLDDGTAARTRPLSFDEIMLKRKSRKKLLDDENAVVAEGLSGYGSCEKVSARGNGQSKDENASIVSENGNSRSKYENTEEFFERGNRRSKKENTEKVLEKANRQSRDMNAEKTSERANRKSKDNDREKVSERASTNRRSKDENTGKRSERGSRRSRDENIKNVSDLGNAQREDENSERVSGRANRQTKDENAEKVAEWGESRNKDWNTEKIFGRGDRRGKNGNTERISERINERNKYSSDLQKDFSERDVKGVSKKKEEKISLKDDYLIKSKDSKTQDSDTKLKANADKYLKTKDESKENIHDRRKHSELRSSNSKDEALKKPPSHLTEWDRHVGGRENKRKYRNEVDEEDKDRHCTRRHDRGKDYDTEISDKRQKEDLRKSHYEEIRLEKLRSQEGTDRKKRSVSPVQRLQKHTSYHGREHGKLSSHSLEEKSGQRHSDIDRSKISKNDSSGHYKRHGGSASGLGGYSPRKRRAEAAARTPSPTKHSTEKKKAKWDLAPGGVDATFSVPVLPIFQLPHQTASSATWETFSSVPVSSIPVTPFPGVSTSILTKKNDSVDTVQLTQATRPMRRLYVENIPAATTEKAMLEFLNNLLTSSGANHIQGTQPCISCAMHKEKGQALVEFLTPEDASAALSFNGTSFSGSAIKIRRPKDFVEMATGELEKSVAAVKAITSTVKSSQEKIFIGGIARSLSSKMIMDIASAFGPLKAYHFENRDDLRGPCAFVEYADQSATSKACVGLNGMKLGGQVITVVRVIPNSSILENDENPPFYGFPEEAKPLLDKPTQVLKLKNLLDLETLSSLSRTEIEEVLDDVRLECSRFGTVKSVNIVQNDPIPISTSEALSTSEARVKNVDKESVAPSENLEDDKTNAEAEKIEEGMDYELGEGNDVENGKSVVGNGVEDDKPVEDNDVQDDKSVEGNVVEDDDKHEEGNDKSAAEGDGLEIDKPVEGSAVEDDKPAECNGVEYDKPVEGNDKTADDCTVDESCQSGQFDTDTNLGNLVGDDVLDSQEPTQQASKDKSECTKQARNLKEVSKEFNEAIIVDAASKSDATGKKGDRKYQNDDVSHIFEPGCVFVEFGRAEASCAAAHCLHGRLFNQRSVSVGYVTLDIYQSKFPEGI